MGPARTLGCCEAPPCVFARVESRSVLRARASAPPGHSCPRVRTSSGQCAHTPPNPPCFDLASCGVLSVEDTPAFTDRRDSPSPWAMNSWFQAIPRRHLVSFRRRPDLGFARGSGLSPVAARFRRSPPPQRRGRGGRGGVRPAPVALGRRPRPQEFPVIMIEYLLPIIITNL